MWNMILGNTLLLLNLTYFSDSMFKRKYKNKYVIPFAIILGVVVLASRSYPALQLYGTLIMISYYIVFLFSLYEGQILHKIITLVIYVFVASISEVLATNLINLLFGLLASDLNTFMYSFALILSATITFSLLGFSTKLLQLNSRTYLPKSTWLILILPITTLLLIINLSNFFESFKSNVLIAPIIVGLLIANFVTMYVFFQTIHVIELENEMKSMKMKYETINMLYQNNFNFLHDTTRKLIRLSSYLRDKNYDELSSQINELSDTMLVQYNTINSNSVIISSILNYRLNDIVSNNIRIKTDILCNDFSFLNTQTQNELFSVIINNAIDSCIAANSESPTIIIKSNLIDHNIIIQCYYSFKEIHEIENNHNIELIKKYISKFNGNVNNVKNSEGYCDLTIILPNVK